MQFFGVNYCQEAGHITGEIFFSSQRQTRSVTSMGNFQTTVKNAEFYLLDSKLRDPEKVAVGVVVVPHWASDI